MFSCLVYLLCRMFGSLGCCVLGLVRSLCCVVVMGERGGRFDVVILLIGVFWGVWWRREVGVSWGWY